MFVRLTILLDRSVRYSPVLWFGLVWTLNITQPITCAWVGFSLSLSMFSSSLPHFVWGPSKGSLLSWASRNNRTSMSCFVYVNNEVINWKGREEMECCKEWRRRRGLIDYPFNYHRLSLIPSLFAEPFPNSSLTRWAKGRSTGGFSWRYI